MSVYVSNTIKLKRGGNTEQIRRVKVKGKKGRRKSFLGDSLYSWEEKEKQQNILREKKEGKGKKRKKGATNSF